MNTLKFGNGEWYGKKDTILAYNDENSNFKPLAFNFERNTLATRVNKDGLIETVGSGEPRIDYKDDSKGVLLLEPSRSNNLLQSNQFDTTWLKSSGVTITSKQAISPDGNNNGWKFEKTAASYKSIGQGYTSLSETTFSVFAKKGTLSIITLFANISGGTNLYQRFDLENGTLSSGAGMSNSNIEYYGNGWYRCSSTFTNANVTSLDFFAEFGETNEGYIYIYGGQAEQGSYATSYIPTQGGAVTRVAESCSQTPPSGIIGQTEGTMFIDVDFDTLSDVNMFLSIRPNSSNKIEIYRDGNIIYAETASSNSFNISKTNITVGRHKIAFAYSSGSSAMYINGVLIGSDTTTFAFTSTLDDIYINSRGTSFIEQSNYNEVKLYNTRLSNAELAALTTI